ncbi:MAG TPA: hypothetical protein VGP63_09415 [Planctomycetaceae bacterium]|jgi:hypothetical protein|nr:hypothetical protein [Planctomycetaceae bacterium]
MSYKNRPLAFVAMRFRDDHWRDKSYVPIREELEAAGYQVLRADELRTSGAIVEEVCRLLKEADLVVLDDSGDSHSVSYELGFCHGVGRDPGKTLLLRNTPQIPFNYQHYRHRVYKDVRHLRRLLRDFLSISEPLTDDMYGYAFTFEYSDSAVSGYIMDGAETIIDALLETEFTGRCEIFAGEQVALPDRLFTIGAAVRLRGKTNTPSYATWMKLVVRTAELTRRFNGRIQLDQQLSELADKRGMKAWFPYCGAAEIRDGQIVTILDTTDDGNFFDSYIRRKTARRTPAQDGAEGTNAG